MLVLDDFNLDCLTNDSDDLQEICVNLNLAQLIDEPTRPTLNDPSKSTLIDLVLCNGREQILPLEFLHLVQMTSAPWPALEVLDWQNQGQDGLSKEMKNILMNRLFLTDIANSNIQYTTEILAVEQALKHFTNSLVTIFDKHAPFKKFRIKDRSNPWVSSEPSVIPNTRDNAWALTRRTGEEDH